MQETCQIPYLFPPTASGHTLPRTSSNAQTGFTVYLRHQHPEITLGETPAVHTEEKEEDSVAYIIFFLCICWHTASHVQVTTHRGCNCFNLLPPICGGFWHSQKINIKYCLQRHILAPPRVPLCRDLQSSMSGNRWLIPCEYHIISGLIVHVEKCISLRRPNFHLISNERRQLKNRISSLYPEEKCQIMQIWLERENSLSVLTGQEKSTKVSCCPYKLN